MIDHVFQGCLIGVEEQTYPDGSTGRTLMIAQILPGSDPPVILETWRYPMNEAQARQVSNQLAGKGLVRATPGDLPPGMHLPKNGHKGHPAGKR